MNPAPPVTSARIDPGSWSADRRTPASARVGQLDGVEAGTGRDDLVVADLVEPGEHRVCADPGPGADDRSLDAGAVLDVGAGEDHGITHVGTGADRGALHHDAALHRGVGVDRAR